VAAQHLRQVSGRGHVVQQQPRGQERHVGPRAAAACRGGAASPSAAAARHTSGRRDRRRVGPGRRVAAAPPCGWMAGTLPTQAAALLHLQLVQGKIPGQLGDLRRTPVRGPRRKGGRARALLVAGAARTAGEPWRLQVRLTHTRSSYFLLLLLLKDATFRCAARPGRHPPSILAPQSRQRLPGQRSYITRVSVHRLRRLPA
jgi:hypothetical protein